MIGQPRKSRSRNDNHIATPQNNILLKLVAFLDRVVLEGRMQRDRQVRGHGRLPTRHPTGRVRRLQPRQGRAGRERDRDHTRGGAGREQGPERRGHDLRRRGPDLDRHPAVPAHAGFCAGWRIWASLMWWLVLLLSTS